MSLPHQEDAIVCDNNGIDTICAYLSITYLIN